MSRLHVVLFLGLVGCVSDAPVDQEAGAGCSDPTFCDDKCGSGLADKCGMSRTCSSCGVGSTCDGNTHKCACTELPNLCDNRCGMVPTNCGTMKDCGGCDGGACPAVGNCSGCVPDDVTACAGKECGTATNNCMQHIVCGTMNGACPGDRLCSMTGKCCSTQSVACLGKCGMVTASCDAPFDCGGCIKTNTCNNANTCVCNCPALVANNKAPNCVTRNLKNGCSCANSNGNTDVVNCGCQNVVCPTNWTCESGMCVPP